MERSEFDKIVVGQVKVTNHKEIIKYYKKIGKRCGFLNLRGYDSTECGIKPTSEYGEIRLVELKSGDSYEDSIKIKDPIDGFTFGGRYKKSYGINGEYFIQNIGDDCHTVFKLNAAVTRAKKLKEIGI